MISALTFRAWRGLTRHRLRSILAILTLAGAVAGVWIFVTPVQLSAAMDDHAERDQLHDVILRPDGVVLDGDDMTNLRDIPNVAALDVRSFWFTDIRVGDRTQDVVLVGVDDFSDQQVNIVHIDAGGPPAPVGRPEAVSDTQNIRSGRLSSDIGAIVSVRDAAGAFRDLTISAKGSTLFYAHSIIEGDPILYVPSEVISELSGFRGTTQVEFRVIDRDDAATAATIDAVRAQLAQIKPSVRYNSLVEIRPIGEWPGEDEFDNFAVLFWVIGGVSLLSAVVLVATTMNALVREQRREIAIMKALGGRRRQIAGNVALSGLLLGGAGTIVGIASGLVLSNLLISFLGTELIGANVDWQVSWIAIGLSIVVGMGGTIVASLPALRRVVRSPVSDALGSPGITAGYGQSNVDRALSHGKGLPRAWQLGIRGAARQKGRSSASVIQVALAVGTMLAFASTVITMIAVSEQSRLAEGGDITLWSSGEGRVLDGEAVDMIATVDGVDEIQPIVGLDALVGNTDTFVWGLPADPVYHYELDEGRWFSEPEDRDMSNVAVIGPALANLYSLEPGDDVRVETGPEPLIFEVIGVDTTMVGDGFALFAPITTILEVRGMTEPTQFWLTTTSSSHDDIDKVARTVQTALDDGGYGSDHQIRYIDIEAERSQDRTVIAVILSMGIPVVAIGMIGLVSTMTMNILERSREIGVLRTVGARSRDIRRIFRAEGVVLVGAGWLLGIGVGYGLGLVIMGAINSAFHVDFSLRYPLWPLGVALVVGLAVAGLAMARPLRRASRLATNDALRYQ